MTDAGYTLTETLAAMAVIGLGATGVGLGMQVLGGQQAAIGGVALKAQETRAAEAWLTAALGAQAPFIAQDAQRLSGDAEGFNFVCGAVQPCRVDLAPDDGRGRRLQVGRGAGTPAVFRLPESGPARFVYRGGGEAANQWPPSDPTSGDTLRSVALLQGPVGREQPVLTVRVRAQQPLDCAYDAVTGACR